MRRSRHEAAGFPLAALQRPAVISHATLNTHNDPI